MPSLGNRVSSAGARVTMDGGGKSAALVSLGYKPEKVCCTDSRALGIGVARMYIISLLAMSFGICVG